jgi:hypothetical protein
VGDGWTYWDAIEGVKDDSNEFVVFSVRSYETRRGVGEEHGKERVRGKKQ